MLMEIPNIIIPEVYEAIYRMGHMDELVIADANYLGRAMGGRIVRSYAASNHELLDAILRYLPLDDDEPYAVAVMAPDHGYSHDPEIWADYERILREHEYLRPDMVERLPRREFYARTGAAFATVQTNDERLYADIIVRKGVVVNA